MSKRNLTAAFPVNLQDKAAEPLHHQLYNQLRDAILSGQLVAGMALPSTRRFAEELGVSRTTIICAYEQLLAEGYAEGRAGAGTYVTRILPDEHLQTKPFIGTSRQPGKALRPLSPTGEYYQRERPPLRLFGKPSTTFPVGIPALDAFPLRDWQRLVTSCHRTMQHKLLYSLDPAGYRPLREALSNYLKVSRAVNCTPEQILIVRGTQQALDLTARLLLAPGDHVWVEDPGYRMARRALESTGSVLVPVPVDPDGLDVQMGIATCNAAKLAYVTPSHQFPLGFTMKVARRLALLNWASQVGAWIVEDDYDSELRFSDRPLPSLQGLDTDGRVIYVGTFNKILFPALRVGYMVVPADLVDTFVFANSLGGGLPPLLEQAVLTRFIVDGLFERHIRRMRALYMERQNAFLEHSTILAPWLEFYPSQTGMHLIGWLHGTIDDWEVARRAAKQNVIVAPVSNFSLRPLARKGLLVGYAAADIPSIDQGIKDLAVALREFQP